MNCFPCFQARKQKKPHTRLNVVSHAVCDPGDLSPLPAFTKQKQTPDAKHKKNETGNIAAQTFTFRELAAATKNFKKECLLGEGGFGKVFKGTLNDGDEIVAVKQLDRNGTQGNKEFLVEVLMLSLLHHPNLVSLVGYCADGEQRLLVYEYMAQGSLEHKLFETAEDDPLDWITRMKIATGAAQGLEYLHTKANPPVIYRDMKPSNILLDEDFTPKLSDFGLAKLGQGGNKTHISPRVIGSYGYSSPEYEHTGELTTKSDMYSFGVVLLELITGRRAIDTTRRAEEQNLVTWAQPIFKDPRRFPEMADPLLKLDFPVKALNQAIGVAAMCLQDAPEVRPLITDVVAALTILTQVQDESKQSSDGDGSDNHEDEDYSDNEDEERSLCHGGHRKDEGNSSHRKVDGSDINGEAKKVKKSIRWSSDVMRRHRDSMDSNASSKHMDTKKSTDGSVDHSSSSISRQSSNTANLLRSISRQSSNTPNLPRSISRQSSNMANLSRSISRQSSNMANLPRSISRQNSKMVAQDRSIMSNSRENSMKESQDTRSDSIPNRTNNMESQDISNMSSSRENSMKESQGTSSDSIPNRANDMESQDISNMSSSRETSMKESQGTSSDSIPDRASNMELQDLSVDPNSRHSSHGVNLRSNSTMEPGNRSAGSNLRSNSMMFSRGRSLN